MSQANFEIRALRANVQGVGIWELREKIVYRVSVGGHIRGRKFLVRYGQMLSSNENEESWGMCAFAPRKGVYYSLAQYDKIVNSEAKKEDAKPAQKKKQTFTLLEVPEDAIVRCETSNSLFIRAEGELKRVRSYIEEGEKYEKDKLMLEGLFDVHFDLRSRYQPFAKLEVVNEAK